MEEYLREPSEDGDSMDEADEMRVDTPANNDISMEDLSIQEQS